MQLGLGPARLAVLVAAFALFLALAPTAIANHVQCGDVITQDTTLDSDLVNCKGTGLVIGADDVTLNLGGYTIDGLGVDVDEGAGILNEGFDRVTIRNGFVRDFINGVVVRAADNAIRHVTVEDLTTFGHAFALIGDGNRIEHSGALGGGLYVRGDFTRVAHNLVTDESQDTFLSVSGRHASVVHNAIHISGAVCRGLDFFLVNSVIAHNSLFGDVPVPSEGECFGYLGSGENTLLKHNSAIGTSTGFAVWGNLTLEGNVANRNGWNGITAGSGVTLTRNTANGNGNFGMEARDGTTDGGGNKARHNGNPAQCVGVRCK